MRKQFKATVSELAAKDDKLVLILGDISVYLFNDFKQKHPDRFYNMGICENTLISAAAGLSSQGFFPFVHTIAPFITERSFEQIKDDMCYNQFGGNIVSIGGSFDYAWDGATHHCYTDLGILRMLPGMEVLQPGSAKEVDILVRKLYRNGKPTYFRLSDNPHAIDVPCEFGKGVVLKEGRSGLTVMTAGPLLGNVLEACRDLDVNLVYFHAIKPIDKDVILKFKDSEILVVHDAWGLYEAVCSIGNLSASYHGIPQDQFCTWYGKVADVRKMIGLDPASIREIVSHKIRSGPQAAK
ncbi:MAG: hypothetical protein A2902_00115 [Elusimicrobia bacterium RIFCSPLOWO2_01_FULL_64_13]|nr:MAG: hypothetical protein A2902_00115 [Elusimicrobia bacterium RIFCSPLOWO2_01_FULL_64_13]